MVKWGNSKEEFFENIKIHLTIGGISIDYAEEFLTTFASKCESANINPVWAFALINAESGWNPQAYNGRGDAYGFNQKQGASGESRSKLELLSQIDPIIDDWNFYKWSIDSAEELALTNFLPIRVQDLKNSNFDRLLDSMDSPDPKYRFTAEEIASANPFIPGKKTYSIGEYVAYLHSLYPSWVFEVGKVYELSLSASYRRPYIRSKRLYDMFKKFFLLDNDFINLQEMKGLASKSYEGKITIKSEALSRRTGKVISI